MCGPIIPNYIPLDWHVLVMWSVCVCAICRFSFCRMKSCFSECDLQHVVKSVTVPNYVFYLHMRDYVWILYLAAILNNVPTREREIRASITVIVNVFQQLENFYSWRKWFHTIIGIILMTGAKFFSTLMDLIIKLQNVSSGNLLSYIEENRVFCKQSQYTSYINLIIK